MNLDVLITQVKSNCAIFNGRVAGSADYATGLETVVSLPLPAAFIYPLEESIHESSGMGGSFRQMIEERIAVVVEIDNTSDRRGQAAAATIETIKFALFGALCNWNPSPFTRYGNGMYYAGSHLIGFDRARLFWQFEFTLVSTITQDDGFIPPSNLLEEIVIIDPTHANLEVDIQIQDGIWATGTFIFTATGHIA